MGGAMRNLATTLEESARKYPDKNCIIFKDEVYSYREVHEQVCKTGHALLSMGVGKGDRVVVCLLNCPEFVFTFYALAKIGAIAVPINYLLRETEIKYILEDSGTNLVITDINKLPEMSAIKPEGMRLLVVGGVTDGDDMKDFRQALEKEPTTLDSCPVEREDICHILYTSGTTGRPKGVMLTHHSVLFCSSLFHDNDDLQDENGPFYSKETINVSALPFYHCYGQNVALITPIVVGGTLVVIERFNTDSVLEAITKYRASVFAGVPTMYSHLANRFDPQVHDLSSLRFCCSTGAALPDEVMKEFKEKTGVWIVQGFGITEASAQALAIPACRVRELVTKIGSIGLPLKNSEVTTWARVVDEHEHKLLPHEIGELVLKGDHVMQGYWNLPEETGRTIVDGWLHTGDLAKTDEDGYFYIVDRKKDLIIVGGENVVPGEIEEVLYKNPGVVEAAAVGIPDRVRGEVVKAVVALKPGYSATEEEIIDFCSQHLAKFKVPRMVEFRTELPKSATGKILRRLLK